MIRYLVSIALVAALTVTPVHAAIILVNPYAFTSYLGQDAFEIVTALSETTSLQFCLDAGDATSYTSGQVWNDLSGNTQHFDRGGGPAANTDDPTFNGVAGTLSSAEYFSFDGGDKFEYDTSNETWMVNVHKDNAAFTFVFWFYLGTTGSQALVGTTEAAGGGVGFRLRNNASDRMSLQVRNDTTTMIDRSGTLTANLGAWNFIAVSLDEAAGASGLLYQSNGSQETFSSTYTSPSTAAAASTLQLGANGAAGSPILANGRLAMVCAWSRALSAGSLNSFFEATRTRFGI
jgi:hypothetical protein